MKAIRSILAAVDLARTTRLVLNTADTMARTARARLHVVHAVEFDRAGFPKNTSTFRGLVQTSTSALESALDRWLPDVEPASVEVVVYSEHKSIAQRARQVRADLIVIGAHGQERALLGTTADRVLRTARCPVWIARRALHLPVKRLVITTDFSPAAQAALDAAAAFLKTFAETKRRTEVTVLHVYHPALQRTLVEHLRRMVDEAAGWIVRHDLADLVRARGRMVKSPHTARAVNGFARRQSANLLVLGTHGHGAIDRLLLGSTTARVLREPPCNVLAVPAAPS